MWLSSTLVCNPKRETDFGFSSSLLSIAVKSTDVTPVSSILAIKFFILGEPSSLLSSVSLSPIYNASLWEKSVNFNFSVNCASACYSGAKSGIVILTLSSVILVTCPYSFIVILGIWISPLSAEPEISSEVVKE
jgi:hypothetical protein